MKGYEGWQVIAPSQTEDGLKAILGNPAMIQTYKDGFPDNGRAVPDGAMMAKIEWSKGKPCVALRRQRPGRAEVARVHGERLAALCRFGWLGLWEVRVQRGYRYDDAIRYRVGLRIYLPHSGEIARLRVHELRSSVAA